MSFLEAQEREERLRNERHLAAAARVLCESGHNKAAALLLTQPVFGIGGLKMS